MRYKINKIVFWLINFIFEFGLVNCVEKYSSKYVNLNDYNLSLINTNSSLILTLSKTSKLRCSKACSDRKDCKLALVKNKESSSCQLYSVEAEFEFELVQPDKYFTKQEAPNGNQETFYKTYLIPDLPRTCKEINDAYGIDKDDKYLIYPDGKSPLVVYCEMTRGGWTRIMNKIDQTVAFNKSWSEYKNGFGDINGNHWIGLENIRRILNNNSMKLRLEGFDSTPKFHSIEYSNFYVDTEANLYKLTLGTKIIGDLFDQSSFHNGMKFSTFDNDNDKWSSNCALRVNGGWWHNDCYRICPTCQDQEPNPFGQYCVASICDSNRTNYQFFNNIKLMIIQN